MDFNPQCRLSGGLPALFLLMTCVPVLSLRVQQERRPWLPLALSGWPENTVAIKVTLCFTLKRSSCGSLGGADFSRPVWGPFMKLGPIGLHLASSGCSSLKGLCREEIFTHSPILRMYIFLKVLIYILTIVPLKLLF